MAALQAPRVLSWGVSQQLDNRQSNSGIAGVALGGAAARLPTGRGRTLAPLIVAQISKTSKLSASALSPPKAPPQAGNRTASNGAQTRDRISARTGVTKEKVAGDAARVGQESEEMVAIAPSDGVTRASLETPVLTPMRSDSHSLASTRPRVPVYVMMPLDTVRLVERDGKDVPMIMKPEALELRLRSLKKAGVVGVMVDIWWGIVEADEPGEYNWSAYQQLMAMIQGAGLKCQAVMSFHACGGNVGDTAAVCLPQWVLDCGKENPDVFFTDRHGVRNSECISLGCDKVAALAGRTPVQVYRDFTRAFFQAMGPTIGHTVTEITVGLGPAGELRYPSYPEGDGRWRFPGVGEFQCYDKYMLASLKEAAEAAGHPEWGHAGPHDAGHYNSLPWETGFFNSDNGTFASEYGRFFLRWYSKQLVRHADDVLEACSKVIEEERMVRMRPVSQRSTIYSFVELPVDVGAKVPGVHWWYNARAHAAELTAGYYNTRTHNGYAPIAKVLRKYGATLNFTCVEMRDSEHPPFGRCSPESLLQQVRLTCLEQGVPLAGENALQRYDEASFCRIEESAFAVGEAGYERPPLSGEGEEVFVEGACDDSGWMRQLTFLRMGDPMWDNWDTFEAFLKRMRRVRTASDDHVHGRNCQTA